MEHYLHKIGEMVLGIVDNDKNKKKKKKGLKNLIKRIREHPEELSDKEYKLLRHVPKE